MPALKLPALKPSHMKSLVPPANEAAAIWISDDDSDDSSEPGTSVGVDDVHVNPPWGDDATPDAGDRDADRGEGHDDLTRQERDADGDGDSHAHEDWIVSDNNNSTVRVRSSRGTRDGYDAAPATPGGDVSAKDLAVYDGPYSDSEDRGGSNYGTVADKPQVLDQRGNIDTYIDAAKPGNIANSRESVVIALKNIRFWLDQLEAELTPRGKQRQTFSAPPPAKRLKSSRRVNVMATRACVQWDDDAEVWEYTWQRGRDGRCWVRDLGAGKREEVDGGYLLCYASRISIDIRANADWLPITVRWNDGKRGFQGLESIESGMLTVEETVMLDIMSGAEGEHFGYFSRSRSTRDHGR